MRIRLLNNRFTSVLAIGLILFPVSLPAQTHGIVDYTVQWGSNKQTYTFVFSGIVTCGGHPCARAQVEVDLESEGRPGSTETTVAEADGRYRVQMALPGAPADSTIWKLIAKSVTLSQGQAAEVEGRVILMQDQTTVVVERPIQIVEG